MPETQWRVEARATSYDYQILRPSRSVDDKAVWAARGPRRRSGSEESEATCVRVPGAVVRAWWRVRLPLVVEFLGFFRERLWSTSVVLVSSGEAGICTDLRN